MKPELMNFRGPNSKELIHHANPRKVLFGNYVFQWLGLQFLLDFISILMLWTDKDARGREFVFSLYPGSSFILASCLIGKEAISSILLDQWSIFPVGGNQSTRTKPTTDSFYIENHVSTVRNERDEKRVLWRSRHWVLSHMQPFIK